MKSSSTLLRLFGIDIKLHISWWFIFILLAWSLSSSYFPQILPDLDQYVYWSMGIAAALLLFISVILHELSHSLVARAKRIKVESITLFFFGGVAQIPDEDMKPSAELQVALAGPLFSFVLGGIFYAITALNGNLIITAITSYLSQLNLTLAIFNLIPGFPLDGGRAFRAILCWHYKDLRKATYIASMGGKFFAGVLVFLGIFGLISGVGNGLWFILLGAFLYFLAGRSYEQVVVKQILGTISVSQVLTAQGPTVPSNLKFIDFVKKYSSGESDAFIVKGKNFRGILDMHRVDAIQKSLQEITPLEQAAIPFSAIKTLTLKDTAYTAFNYFNEYNVGLLPVMEKGKIRGVVTRRMVMQRLMWGMKWGMK
ncbi:MAG TPA: site-2 protease family protein [Candidatus Nanoarchaeia archaeon]|nr:site-2 protease family protein [Candidatus Nanoarchaeia archaeon]